MPNIVKKKEKEGVITHVLLEEGSTLSRQDVVNRMKGGEKFYSKPDGSAGTEIHIYTRNGVDYLRSDNNEEEKDNLDELEDF